MAPTVDERMAALEARVDRLEATLADRPPAPADPEGTFWALEGLKERLPEPGGVLFTGAVTLADGHRAEWQQGFDLAGVLDAFDEEAAAALSALAHPIRLLIVRQLLDGERSVAQLGAHEGMGTSGQLYHHLRQLASAGWLRSSSRGRYRVPTERVVPILAILAAVRR